jgi:uncharacterized protein YbjT (DUF2867 family)
VAARSGQTRAPKVLVAGATGFVGRALVPALLEHGCQVRACARHLGGGGGAPNLEQVRCDLLDPQTLPSALAGMDAAYYLVHSLGGAGSFSELDRRAASLFVEAAAAAGIRRIIYLGGVAPRGRPSEHLASRLEVGRILRAGPVPTLELRAAMIVGPGSASWQMVRDLALRLPAMILPAWLTSKLSPIALEDVICALLDGLQFPLPQSAWFDLPGPEVLSGKEILERIAALEGRRLPSISLPWLTPHLSAMWLRLVTRTNLALARELVFGLTEDLLAENTRYWELTGRLPTVFFDAAARAALAAERLRPAGAGRLGLFEEALVRRAGPRARPRGPLSASPPAPYSGPPRP